MDLAPDYSFKPLLVSLAIFIITEGGVTGFVDGMGYDSFDALKSALGSAGQQKAWHHIVEQNQISKSGFATSLINNTMNIVSIASGFSDSIHGKISGHYGSKQPYTNGMKVRDWLAGQSFEDQFEYGLQILSEYGTMTQTTSGWTFTPFD